MFFLRKLLFPLTILFYIGYKIRNLAYSQGWLKITKVSVPVVSIGNLSMGGTGKTPMACYIIGYYLSRGLKVGYLSRGYGRETKGYRRVVEHADSARMFGDEPVLISNRYPEIPTAVSEDRIKGAKRLIRESELDVLILDDAFQHRQIARDLDIVMIDATRMPDRDIVIPAGNLRETRASLKRAGLVVCNKIPENYIPENYERRLNYKPIVFARAQFTELIFFRPELKPAVSTDELLKRPVIVFAGLGNNNQFFQQLTDMGVEIRKTFGFEDHHRYTEEDLRKITLEYRRQVPERPDLMILTTEKDFCRLNSVNLPAALAPYVCAYIRMELIWVKGKEILDSTLDKIIES